MLDSTSQLLLGLVSGIVFGFLLQKGRVSKYSVILAQFLLKDFTVFKVMFSAIIVGGVGVLVLQNAELASAHIKPAAMVAIGVGGVLFGVGMALLGYCPGTGVAAAAEGSLHAVFGILGMLAGAAVYAEVYPFIHGNLLAWGDYEEITWYGITGVSAWFYLIGLAAASVAGFVALERWERKKGGQPGATRSKEKAGGRLGVSKGTAR